MLLETLNQRLRERAAQGLTRTRRVAASGCAAIQHLADGSARIHFCSNDYLSLAEHPLLKQALHEGIERWGAGSGASHLVSGHTQAHHQLENDLAVWMAPYIPNARALFFSTGYMANVAVLTALADRHTAVFADKLNHASLIDGVRLSGAQHTRYPHGQLDRLEALLAHCTAPLKLIVTDAVFSMDGDLADLPRLLALAQQYDAWVIVDDAHGFGVNGPQGRGTLAHANLPSERWIYMGTLGKAAGLSGAFVAAHPTVIECLIQTARTYIYTTASPPAIAHALRVSLQLIAGAQGDARRAWLQQNIQQLRAGLETLIARQPECGWHLPPVTGPIQPLIVGDNAHALALSQALDDAGLWVTAIRPPTVPIGSARLRITLTAAHRPDQIAALLDALEAGPRQR